MLIPTSLYMSPVNVKIKGNTVVELVRYPVTPAIRRLPTNLLLALLVIKWKINSFDFLPSGPVVADALNGQRLPLFNSEIQLPSKHRSYDGI